MRRNRKFFKHGDCREESCTNEGLKNGSIYLLRPEWGRDKCKNGILSLLEGHFFRPENIDIYYTYSVRKLSTTPDSNVLEDLAEKGLRIFPIILPEEYVAFVQKSENINNNKKIIKSY